MRKILVFPLMILMSLQAVPSAMADFAANGLSGSNLSDKQMKRSAVVKEKVELFGLGAKVKVVMRGASTNSPRAGVIDEILPDTFRLKIKDQSLTFRYDQIESVSYTRGKYKARKRVDPAEVRGVAVETGIGEMATIDIISSRQRVKGTILSIGKEDFVLNFRGKQLPVRFDDVKLIEKTHLPVAARTLVIIGAVGGFLALIGIIAAASSH